MHKNLESFTCHNLTQTLWTLVELDRIHYKDGFMEDCVMRLGDFETTKENRVYLFNFVTSYRFKYSDDYQILPIKVRKLLRDFSKNNFGERIPMDFENLFALAQEQKEAEKEEGETGW